MATSPRCRIDVAARRRCSASRSAPAPRAATSRPRAHHAVAQRARLRADRLPPRRRRTSGPAITASARSTSRSRLLVASCRLPASTSRRLPLPAKLEDVQALMAEGDSGAGRSTRPSASTSAMALRSSRSFYDFRHVLVLGRVTSGPGGDVMFDGARAGPRRRFPELADRIRTYPARPTNATARPSRPPACRRSPLDAMTPYQECIAQDVSSRARFSLSSDTVVTYRPPHTVH